MRDAIVVLSLDGRATGCSPADRLTASADSTCARSTDLDATAASGHRRARSTPFWSPDSRSVAFGSQGKLQRVDLAGGRPTPLADAPRLNGGTWSRDGVLLFSPDYNAGILRVSDKGGAVTVVAAPDATRQEGALATPDFLPDGQHFLYSASGQIRWGSLSGPETGSVVPGRHPRFVAPDRLLFVRAGTLFSTAFDPDRRAVIGEPAALPLWNEGQAVTGENQFSVSDTGVLVLKNAFRPDYQLTWFDRQGRPQGTTGAVTRVTAVAFAPQISPDGQARRVPTTRWRGRGPWHLGDRSAAEPADTHQFSTWPVSALVSRRAADRVDDEPEWCGRYLPEGGDRHGPGRSHRQGERRRRRDAVSQ